MASWACYDKEDKDKNDKDDEEGFEFPALKFRAYKDGEEPESVQENTFSELVHKKKIGRNEPCPCGSGKKYKHCCLNKPKEKTPGEILTDLYYNTQDAGLSLSDLQTSIKSVLKRDENDFFNKDWKYKYPKTNAEHVDGRIAFNDFFDAKGIAIDKLVYDALHVLDGGTMFDSEKISMARELDCLAGLRDAFEKFEELCKSENIKSLDEYDSKYMVHYNAAKWMEKFSQLLDEHKNRIPAEAREYSERVKNLF
jgi:hypothetical protein